MKKNTNKIVLITSTQPSINPRLVKEADTLADLGLDVTVIYQYWNKWATKADSTLLPQKKWKAVRVGGSPNEGKFLYYFTRLFHRLFRILRKYIGLDYGIAEHSIGRCTYLLYREAIKHRAILYIGHNPGALAPTIQAAKKVSSKAGFDAEDFHRNEYSSDATHLDVLTKAYLEKKYYSLADYITTASPLISLEYQKLFPNLKFNTILNVFPKSGLIFKEEQNTWLKVFWFSQTIGYNRGIEEIIEAVNICNSHNIKIQIHLLGNPRDYVINDLNALTKRYNFHPSQIQYYSPIPSDSIPHFASKFDIGMATEIGTPYNRDICLTNKIFTYIQAGLAIVASDTSAQKEFINLCSACGMLYNRGDVDSLASVLQYYYDNRHELKKARSESHRLANSELNWETESEKFVNVVNEVLTK